MSNVTRRTFVKGAGLAAGATVAAGAAGVALADDAAGEQGAEEDNSWLGEEPQIEDADVEEVLTADVIVVGMADSGIPAIRAAVEEGVSVLAFERCDSHTSTGGDCAVLGGTIQARYGRGDGFLDVNKIVNEHQQECCYHTKALSVN